MTVVRCEGCGLERAPREAVGWWRLAQDEIAAARDFCSLGCVDMWVARERERAGGVERPSVVTVEPALQATLDRLQAALMRTLVWPAEEAAPPHA